MKYVVFLIDHGMTPYKDIWDINLPGTYILQAFVIHVFGAGAIAWRLFDFVLCFVIFGSMIYLSVPVHWLAGFAAGVGRLLPLQPGYGEQRPLADRGELVTAARGGGNPGPREEILHGA